MTLIALNGLLQSGKDTCYQIIKSLHPQAERIAFADKLKQSAAAALGTDLETLERLKLDEEVHLGLGINTQNKEVGEVLKLAKSIPPFTIRQFLQRYGTEAHRDIFGEGFWVDQTLPSWLDHTNRLLVCTDLRFENEAARVTVLEGLCVEVIRPNRKSRLDTHRSERGLGDYIRYRIHNDGTLEELKSKIGIMLAWMESNDYFT